MNDHGDPEAAAVEAVVQDSFLGIHEGDVARLERIFHPQCWLFGENRSGSHAFPLAGFLEQIGGAPAPVAEGEPFDMRLVSLDRSGPVAVAKVAVLYQGRRYTDYLTLQQAAGRWRIVGKLFFTAD